MGVYKDLQIEVFLYKLYILRIECSSPFSTLDVMKQLNGRPRKLPYGNLAMSHDMVVKLFVCACVVFNAV